MDISFARQLFIDGQFVNATSGKVLKVKQNFQLKIRKSFKGKIYQLKILTIIHIFHAFDLQLYNPHDESLICDVESAGQEDVDRAVAAAEKAFYEGEWGKMSARYQ